MKIIDKLIIKDFIAPYLAAFFIAEFVLIMQFLWKYIDEIIGKGISVGVLFELVFYFGVTIIPLAIPITILISSVMVFGNLAERHELTSYKSAGVSLFRIMGSGMAIAVLTSMFSFYASNYLKPSANYQFLYRFNSIRKQKPSLSIEKGVFNYDFKDFVIRVGDKEKDGDGISDILIYDHSSISSNLINMVTAKDGQMYSSNDGSYFVMKLFDGHQYHEDKSELNKEEGTRTYPMTRTNFKEWTKVFDMSQFELEALDINMDRKKYDLMNSWQLQREIDSFSVKQDRILNLNYLDFKHLNKAPSEEVKEGPTNHQEKVELLKQAVELQNLEEGTNNTKQALEEKVDKITKPRASYQGSSRYDTIPPVDANVSPSLHKHYSQHSEIKKFIKSAHINSIRDKDNYFAKQREYKSLSAYKRIYQLRRHQQFSWALVCIIFLFIGAPMGSIIRKGGYGYPLLISIIFFMVFIILNILGEKMNKSQVISPILAAWLPALVLIPFAFTITRKAINDEKFEFRLIRGLVNRFRKAES